MTTNGSDFLENIANDAKKAKKKGAKYLYGV